MWGEPGTAVTGFPPGIVNGTIHAADAVAAQAQSDLTDAYNDAAGVPADAFSPVRIWVEWPTTVSIASPGRLG